MKLSINVTNYSWPGPPDQIARHLSALARRADDAGLDTLWVPDHLIQADPTATLDEPMLESYATLGYLAAVTTNIHLGTMVTWGSIRPPALLVKVVTTIDVLSNGRAWLGIGAGYNASEAAMTAVPFAPTAERFARLEEILQLADHLWSGSQERFDGPFHVLERPISSPTPVSRPRILIGGMGERRTLPLVARYADACNLFDVPDGGATLRRKLDVLAAACDAAGRDASAIEVTLSTRLADGETVDQLTDRCATLSALGVDHLVFIRSGPWQPGPELDVILDAARPALAVT
jgi:alkanesulfonate monooxygenase SsuD/methylene tetrahydromethanopterin reductase-like flavin-dependent oxidoreductase (luciferase family)